MVATLVPNVIIVIADAATGTLVPLQYLLTTPQTNCTSVYPCGSTGTLVPLCYLLLATLVPSIITVSPCGSTGTLVPL